MIISLLDHIFCSQIAGDEPIGRWLYDTSFGWEFEIGDLVVSRPDGSEWKPNLSTTRGLYDFLVEAKEADENAR